MRAVTACVRAFVRAYDLLGCGSRFKGGGVPTSINEYVSRRVQGDFSSEKFAGHDRLRIVLKVDRKGTTAVLVCLLL